MSIPEHIIEEIKTRSSITEIAGEFVQLKRAGTNQVGLCPFHSEKSPSFNVREEQGTFHCFGCGKHGNAFTLLMELRGMSFPEAVKYLARRAGIDLPETASGPGRQQEEELRKKRNRARLLTAKANDIFRGALQSRGAALEYLSERGIRDETREEFQLGFAPDSRAFLQQTFEQLLPELQTQAELSAEDLPELLLELGLIKRREGNPSEIYDVFRNRIIFPIFRSDGAAIAFGGRLMPQGDMPTRAPKYLNSCESLLYSKRQTLYGIPQAMKDLRSKRQAFLVEGYMDVLGMHQAGVRNALATCGTAVSDQHASLLRRFVERVTIVFDGDAAGMKAAAGCFEAFLNSGLDCFVVALPDGEDPDTLAQKLSTADFQSYLESKKRSLFEVYLESLIREINAGDDVLTPTTSGKIAVRLAQIVSRVKNSVEREFLLRMGAERLGATVSSLERLIAETKNQFPGPRSSLSSARPPRPVPSQERGSGGFVMDAPQDMQGPPPVAAPYEGPSYQRAPYQKNGYARSKQTAQAAPTMRSGQKKALKFYHQLLIAVVTEPTLAADLLRSPTLEEPENQILMPEKLRRFLEAVRDRVGSENATEAGFTEEAAWDQPLSALSSDIGEEELSALLEAHGFPAATILKESKIQMGSKGANPLDIVQSAQSVSNRQQIEREIDVLRTKQSEPGDTDYLLKIAQEKLEKRRSLERINKG